MEKEVLNITCTGCHAPAKYDIVSQEYHCSYCGSKITVESVMEEKRKILEAEKRNRRKKVEGYSLLWTNCSGCNATLVFEKDDALSNCEFCGRSLVRKQYAKDAGIPQYVVPFALTKEEAAERLRDWCEQNKKKREAKHLLERISTLNGYYLPYEMVRGPVRCQVKKVGETSAYKAYGYLNEEFVNGSSQLDNLVLDEMEPYDTDTLEQFDFSYVAGHRVKITDLKEEELKKRLEAETTENVLPYFEKMWGTKDISVDTEVNPVVKVPVLLPAYYISDGDVRAAVNGQTGKVSVRAEKLSMYVTIPWWITGIFILVAACGLTFLAAWAGHFDFTESLLLTGILGVFYLIVFLCMFDGTSSNTGSITRYRKMFSSGKQLYKRVNGRLVLRADEVKRRSEPPVFKMEINGVLRPVIYEFRSFRRSVEMILMAVLVIVFPLICALIINGFDFTRFFPAGSGAWFCVTVPTVPIVLIREGVQWLYEKPRIDLIEENGKRKRYRKLTTKETLKEIVTCIGILFLAPPWCFIGWSLVVMIYLTAFGFK